VISLPGIAPLTGSRRWLILGPAIVTVMRGVGV